MLLHMMPLFHFPLLWMAVRPGPFLAWLWGLGRESLPPGPTQLPHRQCWGLGLAPGSLSSRLLTFVCVGPSRTSFGPGSPHISDSSVPHCREWGAQPLTHPITERGLAPVRFHLWPLKLESHVVFMSHERLFLFGFFSSHQPLKKCKNCP